ncbi:MAG: hypothetical protein ACK48U_00005, partial [Planctomyces sp.]
AVESRRQSQYKFCFRNGGFSLLFAHRHAGIPVRRESLMVEVKYAGNALWDRIERAVEKVKDRLRRVGSGFERG